MTLHTTIRVRCDDCRAVSRVYGIFARFVFEAARDKEGFHAVRRLCADGRVRVQHLCAKCWRKR